MNRRPGSVDFGDAGPTWGKQALGQEIAMTTTTLKPATTSLPTVAATGVVAAIVAAAVLYAYGAVAQAAGVPMFAADPGAARSAPIGPADLSGGVLFCAVPGILLAVALARWASRPARAFGWTTTVLVLVSMASPAFAAHTATSTKLMLAGGHLLAAILIVPAIAHRLGRTRS